MVMAAFSPQYVGQEFVRQYYTMLNKDPLKLHSFYVSHSVFTHGVSSPGKAEKPAIGLEAIRDKICQLNFQNCHANIKSLDSHPTIGGGVVVQVSGELSNADCPMRKFTQTFVLAPQDPDNSKKYFVFNDIFRYQDEVFEETEDETHEETVESYADEQGNYQSLLSNHHPPAGHPAPLSVLDSATTPTSECYPPADPIQNASDLDNAPAEEEEVAVVPEEPAPEVDITEPGMETAAVGYEEAPAEVEDAEPAEEPAATPVNDAPVSWASVLKKNSSQAQGAVTKQPPQSANKSVQPTPTPQHNHATHHSSPQQQQHAPKRKEETTKSSFKEDGSSAPRKTQVPLADNCQIFIGNLPSGIQEGEVQNAFKEFGKIVEVRLNSKSFGFVAFEHADSAQKLLDLPKGKIVINNQEINIEKKRPSAGTQRPYARRDRSDSGPPRKSSGPSTGRSQWGGGRGGRGGHQDGDRPHRGGRGGRDRPQR